MHSVEVIKKMLDEAASEIWDLPQKMDTFEEDDDTESSDSADEDDKKT